MKNRVLRPVSCLSKVWFVIVLTFIPKSAAVTGIVSNSPGVNARSTCQSGVEVPANRVDTTDRLQRLRNEMLVHQVDAYIVTTDTESRRHFVSGFTGSAGTAVVTGTSAALWTDGRYFLQAEQQLDCSWVLMKQGQDDSPSITAWLKTVLSPGGTVAADPSLTSADNWLKWEQELGPDISIKALETNLVDRVRVAMMGRQASKTESTEVHPMRFAGVGWHDKVAAVRDELDKLDADSLVISALDEVNWLFNIRNSDSETGSLVTARALVTANDTYLFIDANKVTSEVRDHLNTDCLSQPCVRVEPLVEFVPMLPRLVSSSRKVLVPSKYAFFQGSSFAVYNAVPPEKRVARPSPIVFLKARKNDVEAAGMKNAHLKDAVALCDFLSQLEEEVAAGIAWDELKILSELVKYRLQQADSRGAAFRTVAGFGPNGAVIHYSTSAETNRAIDDTNLLLIDSGGNYLDGTTDVTRTLIFGTPSVEQRDRYTRVLMGAIDLARLVFPRTVTDARIDIIARKYLYEVGLDYLHGTGHGLGHYINNHESPTQIRIYSPEEHVFDENYFFSIEPGYYKEGHYGIRLETIHRVVPRNFSTEFGDRFFAFEPVAFVPFEPKLIETSLMSQTQLDWLNDYHKQTLDLVGPLLLQQGRQRAYQWLVSKTAPLEC